MTDHSLPDPHQFTGASLGTGWSLASGYVVTNNHVIAGSSEVHLVTSAGEELRAWAVVQDDLYDIALLRVDQPHRLPAALPTADSRVGLGASVFTIGFPRVDVMGRAPKLSNGVISGTMGLGDDPSTYQTTVPIQPGNSGGPLLNMRGEVVGVVRSMLGVQDSAQGGILVLQNASCALKVECVEELVSQLHGQLPAIDPLPAGSGDLEALARRIQDSVLIVVAR